MSSSQRSAAVLLLLLLASTSATTAHAGQRPKLGVLLVFDQMPVWLLERYAPFFPDGFGGLDGAFYTAIYPYAGTETGPGHATLSTGALPAVHGIATNSWFADGKKLYAVDDPAFPTLTESGKADYGRSPRQLLTNTLGDAIKTESRGKAHVVTVSHKDRAAILTGGHAADLAIWYDVPLGRFTTSTAYAAELPAWLKKAGAELPANTLATGTWSPLPIPKSLEHLAPPDERAGEAALKGFGVSFPHDIKSVEPALQKSGYRLVPQSITDLFELAWLAVENEKLGADEEPDLLVISVSTTDVVGHNYGGGSLEQLDTLRRADAALRAFLLKLRAKVGANNLVIGLSSDHGAPDLPQEINEAGVEAASLVYDDVVEVAEKAAQAAAPPGKAKRVRGYFPPQLFIDEDDLDAAGKQKLRDAVEAAVEAMPGIAQVYEMGPGIPDEDEYGWLMRGSAPFGRSASLFVRTEPRVVMLEERGQTAGTDHGTPYLYDRRVPFIIVGNGVRRGHYATPVDPRDMSATLAFLLGVPPPDSCQGKPVSAVGDR